MANLDGTGTTVANYESPVTTFMGVGGIAADATHVYWASANTGVFRAAFTDAPCTEGANCAAFGSAVSQSVAIATGQDSPKAIAVLDTFVYWVRARPAPLRFAAAAP